MTSDLICALGCDECGEPNPSIENQHTLTPWPNGKITAANGSKTPIRPSRCLGCACSWPTPELAEKCCDAGCERDILCLVGS